MRNRWLSRLALAAGCAIFFSNCSMAIAETANARAFGKRIVAEYDLPEEQIAKFAAFQPSAPLKHESAIANALLAKTEEWSGPVFSAYSADNPYTIVVTLSAVAKEDGAAATLWDAGWALQSENGNQTRLNVLGGLAKSDAKAGEAFTVTAAATPASFKEDRKVGVVLGLVNARNADIKGVHLQVWSGMAPISFLDLLGPARWILPGVVMAALWYWFKR